MDAELQKSIRQFDPSDVATHGLWQRLNRVAPLVEIIKTIPLSQLTLKESLGIAALILHQISDKLAAITPLKEKHLIEGRNLWVSTEIERRDTPAGVFNSLAEICLQLETGLQEEFVPHFHLQLSGSYDHDYEGPELREIDFGFSVAQWRSETSEEETKRLDATKLKSERAKAAKREKYRKEKEEKERQDREEYERLKKKFEKND